MELTTDIYQDLIKWKKRDSGKVLELEGARQTGKTFILDKFAKENYARYFKDILEVNLFDQIFPVIAQTMIREKKGTADLVTMFIAHCATVKIKKRRLG